MNLQASALYRPLVLSVAFGLVASSLLLTIQMLGAIVGPFRIAELGEHDPRVVVALWQPVQAIAGASVRSAFGNELVESGRAVREVVSLDAIDPSHVGAVVLSEPRALGPTDLAGLEQYLDAGGGVVVIGSIAVIDRDGAWRGHEAMERLLGAQVVVLDERNARAVAAARRGPLSAPLAPRERIEVAFETGTLGVVADAPELRWIGADADARAIAAGIRRAKGKGRIAWLAVPPERAGPRESDMRRVRSVLEAAVAWASRTPSVEVLPWPRGAAFAGVVEAGAAESDAPAAWRKAIAAAQRDAGLAALRMPRETAAQNVLQPALAQALAGAARENGWIATRHDLALWTRVRAVVDASVTRVGPRRLAIAVTNRAGLDLDGLVLRIHLNESVLGAKAEGTKLMQARAEARLLPDGQALDLAVPRLGPRASAAYTIDIEPATAGRQGESEG